MPDEPEKSLKKKTPKKKAPKKAGGMAAQATSAKGKPWTFPKNSLEDAIGVAKAVEEKNAGNPMPAQDVAIAVGFKQSSDWRFLDLLRSANQYGLVTGSGAAATVSLAPLGQDIVAPSSPSQWSAALLRSFRSVKEFEPVERHYGASAYPKTSSS